jgi:hypothetical protein
MYRKAVCISEKKKGSGEITNRPYIGIEKGLKACGLIFILNHYFN